MVEDVVVVVAATSTSFVGCFPSWKAVLRPPTPPETTAPSPAPQIPDDAGSIYLHRQL
ncbi:UNVERIFIED_CONTAM: hypothetical protein Sindi_1843400, partial [Sesamum indicum]